MVQVVLSRPRGWRLLLRIAKTMVLKISECCWALMPVSVLFVTVIAVGFPSTTLLIDVLSIDSGNSTVMQELVAEWHGVVALLLNGDPTSPLVLKPVITKGQGTVSFTFSALLRHGTGMLGAARWLLPLHQRGFHRRVHSKLQHT